jgi:hypothetical protein
MSGMFIVSVTPANVINANASYASVKTVFVKNVRYANRGDIPYLQDFDILVDWEYLLTNKNGGLIVVGSTPQGVYSFQINKTTYFVSNFHMSTYTNGVRLIEDLKERCYKTHRKMISIQVPVECLDLQFFLKNSEFEAISIDKKSDLCYYMTYRV